MLTDLQGQPHINIGEFQLILRIETLEDEQQHLITDDILHSLKEIERFSRLGFIQNNINNSDNNNKISQITV